MFESVWYRLNLNQMNQNWKNVKEEEGLGFRVWQEFIHRQCSKTAVNKLSKLWHQFIWMCVRADQLLHWHCRAWDQNLLCCKM